MGPVDRQVRRHGFSWRLPITEKLLYILIARLCVPAEIWAFWEFPFCSIPSYIVRSWLILVENNLAHAVWGIGLIDVHHNASICPDNQPVAFSNYWMFCHD